MTTDAHTDRDRTCHFNGIDADSGGYLFDALSTRELAQLACGKALHDKTSGREHLAELKARHERNDEAHYGAKAGIDPTRLEQTGWGVIFPAVAAGSAEAREQQAIYEALAPLLALRRSQAARLKDTYYREYRDVHGYRRGESKHRYLARLGAGPEEADPEKVPYYLLLVGSPEVIPYSIQFQLDVQYAVGRIHFDAVEEYAHYAQSVVAAETGAVSLARTLAFVGVANPDDPATQLCRTQLVAPLADLAAGWNDVPGWTITRYVDEQANKASVTTLLGGANTPALLFSASHGLGLKKGHPLQRRHQGALVLQDWPGPEQHHGRLPEAFYLSGDDIPSDARLHGLIAFHFACYGAGTPAYDDFAKQASAERRPIAEAPFVAGLPRRLLGHPKGGALAVIGHVDRAWGYSFLWDTGPLGAQASQLTTFESLLKTLMQGMPVGRAMEYFNQRYAALAVDLTQQIEEREWNADAIDDETLADLWTASNDARDYVVIGDPAVRLPLADAG